MFADSTITMHLQNLQHKEIILASRSPRRQQLLQQLGIPFKSEVKDTDESFPDHLKNEQVVLHLALKKAIAFEDALEKENTVIITADTIVVYKEDILNKPVDRDDALKMLTTLSGNMHEVFTGVCIASKEKKEIFFDRSEVYFRAFTREDIEYYVDNFKPFDKAGSYGIQDWFGLTCIDKINGCFYNVMGLPTNKLYQYLKNF